MSHRKVCFSLGIVLLFFMIQTADRSASETKLGVFSDDRTSYFFSDPDHFCKSPCFLDLGVNDWFIFISEKNVPAGDSSENEMGIDIGIVHNPDLTQPFVIDLLEGKRKPQHVQKMLSRNGDYRVVLNVDTLETQENWTNTENEKIVGFVISPNRVYSLLQTELINPKDELSNPERKIYLRKFNRSQDQNQTADYLIPLSSPPGFKGEIKSFSKNSDWFLIEYDKVRSVSPEYGAPTFYRVIKSDDPDIYFDVGYDEEFAYCMWNHFYPWLFCASISHYAVYELKEDKIEHFSYSRDTYPPVLKIFSIDWISKFVHFGSFTDYDDDAEDFELYDIETGRLALELKGKELFHYSPDEDLMITSRNIDRENNTLVYKLFFYRGFDYEGEKELVSSFKISYESGDLFVDELKDLYNFMLNFERPQITEEDLLAKVNLTYDPELRYSLAGDFLRVSTPFELFEEKLKNEPIKNFVEQYLKEKMTRSQSSPDSIRLNSITDYYFFPKPETQE